MKSSLLLLLAIANAAHGEGGADEISRHATDPTSSLMAMNFQGVYNGDYHGDSLPGEPDEAFRLQFRPAIPLEFLGKPNIQPKRQ